MKRNIVVSSGATESSQAWTCLAGGGDAALPLPARLRARGAAARARAARGQLPRAPLRLPRARLRAPPRAAARRPGAPLPGERLTPPPLAPARDYDTLTDIFFQTSHPALLKTGCKHRFSTKVNSEQHDTWIIWALDEFFHLRVDIDIRTWGVIVYVAYIGPKRKANSFMYQVREFFFRRLESK